MRPPCRTCGFLHDPYTACPPRSARPQPAPAPAELGVMGKILADRYRVGEPIGSGMTGVVFAAEHVAFARPAAVKVVRARHATPDLVTRVFHGDAFAAWGLAHPSLCEVFDIGALVDATPYFVMERLDGETLATRVARERLSLAAAIDMMMQLLSAIVALHSRELLVRDLRPCNVYLVHRRGCRPLVKLLDVGLGRLAPLDRLQDHWSLMGPQPGGHPHYLSPERARGEHLVEVASDIFVAGAVFYESLAGERAFGGTNWRTIVEQVLRGDPVPLHEKRPDVPVELSQFVSRALSPNPRSRPATAKEMQDELRSIFEDARKASASIYGPSASIMTAAKKTPSTSRIAAEPYTDETETRRTPPRSREPHVLDSAPGGIQPLPSAAPPPDVAPPPPIAQPATARPPAPHPAMLDELEQTLERLDNPGARRSGAMMAALGIGGEEEETETTKMSPELRARIEQLLIESGKKR